MTQEEQRTVVTEERTAAPGAAASGVATTSRTITKPSGGETTRRVVVLIFGIIQVVIALRFVLLLIDADEANGLVSGILNFSQFFVGPFEGVLRTNALAQQGSILDLAAVVAFVGWSILEGIILWGVNIFRREPA
jgi:hypothetical protein